MRPPTDAPDTDPLTEADLGAPSVRRRARLVRWIGWAVVVAIIFGYALLNRGEWGGMREAARQARLEFLVLAALAQVCWLVTFGATFWTGLRAVGARPGFVATLPLSWAANFLNMVVKSGGLSGLALFLRDAGRRGEGRSRVTLGYMLTIFAHYAGFLLRLPMTLALLWWGGDLRRLELVAAVSVFAVIVAIMVALVLLAGSTRGMRGGYTALARVVNALARPLRRRPLDPAAAPAIADESVEIVRLVRRRPAALVPLAVWTLAREASIVAVMWGTLRAFDADASLTLAFTASTLSTLFSFVSIVPSGLGLVEVSLTALLTRAGLDPADAVLATLTYRLFQFWTPFIVGALATRTSGQGSGVRGQLSAGGSPGH